MTEQTDPKRQEERKTKEKRKLEEKRQRQEKLIGKAWESHVGSMRSLRTWFIAHGVGAPVLLISSQKALGLTLKPKTLVWAIGPFLVGVVIQIVLEGCRKHAYYWHFLKLAKRQSKSQDSPETNWCWLRTRSMIAVVLDVVTVGLFVFATLCAAGAICPDIAKWLTDKLPCLFDAVFQS